MEKDKKIVAYVIFTIKGSRGLLVSIVVLTKHRGKGIGWKLLEYALQELSQSVKEVELQAGVKNKLAVNFYEEAGFRADGIIHRYYHNGEDALVMIRKL